MLVAETDQEAGMAGLVASLTVEEKSLLATLLNSGQVPPNSELMIETINASALEAIYDNIIDYTEGAPYVYDDYFNELTSLLGELV